MLIGEQARRIAVIDLGSNTARMVVFSTIPGYAYHLDDEIREVVRLRQGMTAYGLSDTAVQRALFTLRVFKRFCDSSRVDGIIATATSAVREAANGPQFVEQVQHELGLELQILAGDREAYYGVLGALNEVQLADGVVLDIGGGSAQLSLIVNRQFVQGEALTLGALALTERFVDHDPISEREFKAVQGEIRRQIDTLPWLKDQQGRQLVGLGGTVRNLARMEAARAGYPLNTLRGFRLTRTAVDDHITQLRDLPLRERSRIAGLSSDRADIILPGALVVAAVMDRLDARELLISTNGLREGLFFEYFWHHLSYPIVADVRLFSVLNMARVYQYQKAHAAHVRYLARRLFDELAPLHGYGRFERELLDAAAMLHDLGTIIDYYDHHKHSQTLIVNSGLAGFSPRETALIALLTRYHRKGKPRTDLFDSLLQEDDTLRLYRLAAILRLAEFLERGRNANVDDVTVKWNDETLRLTLIADEYPAVEIWEAERNAVALIESAFERRVVLESTAVPDRWAAAG